jgi:tetratricopeptide (TPR) repeat protein
MRRTQRPKRAGDHRTSARAIVLGAMLSACSSGSSTAPSRSAAPSPAPSASQAAAAPSGSSSAAAASGDPKRAKSLLLAGRKLAADEHWKDAEAKLTEASALAPEDVTILSELGWAALHADDLDESKAVSERALGLARESRVKAQILYNLGRVLEERGDADGAKQRYQDSLALRPSKTVKARLEGLGGKAPEPPPAPELACAKTFPNTAALCACLSPSASDVCAVDPKAPASASGEFEIVRAPTETDGETAIYLVANAGGGVTPVAELGRDYHPGAFGLDDTATALALDEQTIGDEKVAVARTEIVDVDTTAGGIEVSTVRTLRSTICVLRSGSTPTRCPLSVPIVIDDTLAYPKDPATLSPDQKAYVDAHAKSAHELHVRLDVKLSAKGDAEVTLVKGDAKDVPGGVLGRHSIF